MAEDPFKYFRIEARELHDQLSQGVLALESSGPQPESVARLLRLAHTLKGAARVVKQREIANQAHAVEDALAPYRETPAHLPAERIAALLAALDSVGALLATLTPATAAAGAGPASAASGAPAVGGTSTGTTGTAGTAAAFAATSIPAVRGAAPASADSIPAVRAAGPPAGSFESAANTDTDADPDTDTEATAIADAASDAAPSVLAAEPGALPVRAPAAATIRADLSEMDRMLDGLAEAQVQLRRVRGAFGVSERARHLLALLSAQLEGPAPRDEVRAAGASAGVEVPALAEQLAATLNELTQGLHAGVEGIDRELRQLRTCTEQLRLCPASDLFTSLERTARDAAQAQDKRVQFQARGGEVRLEAHVLALAQNALLQMVRNAVAHGIEADADRRAAGKPLPGRVTIEVLRRGRLASFLCQDDGRGIDLPAVHRTAQRRGLLPAGGPPPEPGQLIELLLQGGLSTSGVVTELAGRGVGLDLVREVADRLGGEVQVRSTPGQGTTVELVVPVQLSSLAGLVVESAGVVATIPLEATCSCASVPESSIARTAQGDRVVHDGEAIPLLPLHRVLPAGAGAPRPEPARGRARSRACTVVVLRAANGSAALAVDRLLGTAEVVVRPLPALAPASPVVAGASLDPEGQPQLVLDPEGLVAAALADRPPPRPAPAQLRPILVIDDSLTTRTLEQNILESAGYEVELAASAEEALELARQRAYALFLVDVEMPGLDGFQFLERIRADPRTRDIPAVLVTSRDAPRDLQRGYAAGAQAYVIKGAFDQGELLEWIRGLVG
jgi:two-component system, chemotaxis family, sensor kinase CheA